MPSSFPRRKALQLLGTAASIGFSGCQTPNTESDSKATDGGEQLGTSTESPPFTTDDFRFRVTPIKSFTESHPARINIAFSNTSDVNLTGKGGPEYTLPFVDDDYAGKDESGNEQMLLLPDNGGPNYDFNTTSGERGSLEAVIPKTPSDGCWTLSVEWPPAKVFHTLILNRISIPPGDTVDHEYTLYYLDECRDGTFTFESKLEVVKSNPQREYDLRLGFDLIITDGDLSVSIVEPHIDPLNSG